MELMRAAWWMLGALAVLALAYRYYSAFIATKILVLDASRQTPAHRFNDGQNFHPTNRWVLFGHHFAAITGAGPTIYTLASGRAEAHRLAAQLRRDARGFGRVHCWRTIGTGPLIVGSNSAPR